VPLEDYGVETSDLADSLDSVDAGWSLREFSENFAFFGACEKRFTNVVRSARPDECLFIATPYARRSSNLMTNAKFIFLVVQTVFWAVVVFTLVEATIPPGEALHLLPWDKAVHFSAFYVLTFLAAAAFPVRSLWRIGTALSVFGALIELVQETALVHRDSDFWDWVADTVAILAALAPTALVQWRAWLRSD
jgi:hypothetical protein